MDLRRRSAGGSLKMNHSACSEQFHVGTIEVSLR